MAAEDQKETPAVWGPRDPRVPRDSLGTLDLWERGGR